METAVSLLEVGDIIRTPDVPYSSSTYRVRQINPDSPARATPLMRITLDHRPASCPKACQVDPLTCDHWGSLPGHQIVLHPIDRVILIARADDQVVELDAGRQRDLDLRDLVDLNADADVRAHQP